MGIFKYVPDEIPLLWKSNMQESVEREDITCYSWPLVCHLQSPRSHFTGCTPLSFFLQLLRYKNLTPVRALSWGLRKQIRLDFSHTSSSVPQMCQGLWVCCWFLRHWVRSETRMCWHRCSAVSCWWLSAYPVILAYRLYFVQPYCSSAEVSSNLQPRFSKVGKVIRSHPYFLGHPL